MKTDADLKRDVEAELAWDPAVRSTDVGVSVKEGVVTLSGHIGTYAEKYAIQRALRRVPGVKAIAIELDVTLAPNHRRSDTEIALAIEHALKWNTVVPDKITVMVDKGWVTLQGEVEWDYQRRSVEDAVRHLMGVVGISNDIAIKPRVAPTDIEKRIAAALQRQLERELKRIEVKVEGSTVTLKGSVNSWHERDAAQGVAWQAPGVRAVINELRIA